MFQAIGHANTQLQVEAPAGYSRASQPRKPPSRTATRLAAEAHDSAMLLHRPCPPFARSALGARAGRERRPSCTSWRTCRTKGRFMALRSRFSRFCQCGARVAMAPKCPKALRQIPKAPPPRFRDEHLLPSAFSGTREEHWCGRALVTLVGAHAGGVCPSAGSFLGAKSPHATGGPPCPEAPPF